MNQAVNKPLRRREKSLARVDWALAAILAITVLARAGPLFINGFVDPDSYYHLRLTEAFLQVGGIPAADPLSFVGRPYTYYPLFHAVGAVTSVLWGVGPQASMGVLAVAASLAATLAVFALVKRLAAWLTGALGKYSGIAPYLSALWMAVMPGAVVRSSFFSRPDAFAIAVAPILILLLLDSNYFAAFVLFFILVLLHMPAALVLLLMLAIIQGANFVSNRSFDLKFLAASTLGFLLGGSYYLKFPVLQYYSPAIFASSELASFDLPFLVFYVSLAFVFSLLLLHAMVERKAFRRTALLSAWFAFGAALTLFADRNVVFLAPPLAVAAGLGWAAALQRSKKFAPVFLVLTLAIVAVAFGAYATTVKPSLLAGDLAGSQYLASPQSGPAGVVTSLWDRGHMLAAVTGRQVYVDGYFEFSPQPLYRMGLVNSAFAGRQVDLTLLKNYGVNYIYLDSLLLAGQVGPVALPSLAQQPLVNVSKIYDSGAYVYYFGNQ